MKRKKPAENRYAALIESIFLTGYREGMTEMPFHRDELTATAKKLRIQLPKNLGDAIYSIRYRGTALQTGSRRADYP
jgi:hypothetical protein